MLFSLRGHGGFSQRNAPPAWNFYERDFVVRVCGEQEFFDEISYLADEIAPGGAHGRRLGPRSWQ